MRRTVIRSASFGAFAALALLSATAARAHHSFAMFDNDHQIKLKGKVSDFQWQNPHVYIELDVPSAKAGDKPAAWTVECANPGILNRVGWKFNMIKPGDEITIIVAPLRDGQTGALLKQVTLPDGRVFNNGGPAGPALIW
jgi:invasion protein IalB